MKRVARFALPLAAIAACSAPEYHFASVDAGGPNITNRDSGRPSDDDDEGGTPTNADAATDAGPSSDAAPLTVTAMPESTDFKDDCAKYIVPDMGAAVLEDDDASLHCVMFFHSATWKRYWNEAKTMCEAITRGANRGHLAAFPNKKKAENLVAAGSVFPGTLAAWIGLALGPGADPFQKSSWTWVSTTAFNYDGWAKDPSGRACVSWAAAGTPQWLDVDCTTAKGSLCEMDQ